MVEAAAWTTPITDETIKETTTNNTRRGASAGSTARKFCFQTNKFVGGAMVYWKARTASAVANSAGPNPPSHAVAITALSINSPIGSGVNQGDMTAVTTIAIATERIGTAYANEPNFVCQRSRKSDLITLFGFMPGPQLFRLAEWQTAPAPS